MKLDRTLLDKGRAPTVEEMKDYFKKNDYTTSSPTFDSLRAKRDEMNVYMKAKKLYYPLPHGYCGTMPKRAFAAAKQGYVL